MTPDMLPTQNTVFSVAHRFRPTGRNMLQWLPDNKALYWRESNTGMDYEMISVSEETEAGSDRFQNNG